MNHVGITLKGHKMEAEKDINERIIAKIDQIKQEHPELTKYIDEMPLTIPDESNPEVKLKYLYDYYESLNYLLEKYK